MPRFLSRKAKSKDNCSVVLKNKVKILSFHISSWKNKKGCQQKWYTDGLESLLANLIKAVGSSLNRRSIYTKEKHWTIENTEMVNTCLSRSLQTIQRKAFDALAPGCTIFLWVELFKIKKGKDSLDRFRLLRVEATWKQKAIETKVSGRWVLWWIKRKIDQRRLARA